jgi:hypothetical protein
VLKFHHVFVWKKDSIHKFTIGCMADGAILGDKNASQEAREKNFLELSADPNWVYSGIQEDK